MHRILTQSSVLSPVQLPSVLSPQSCATLPRVRELDAIRGVAALAVVAYHLYPATFAWGRTGVDLFFVLSGYLITQILLRHQGSGRLLGAFYARRGLRIWPIYYLALLACVALNRLLERPSPVDGLIYYLTFTQGVPHYWSGPVPPFLPALLHTWTLALEEQFYLIWPALVALAGRRRLAALAVAVAALAVWARARGFAVTILVARCDGFALGGLLAAIPADGGRAGPPRRAFAAVAAAALAGSIAWEWRLLPAWDPLKSLVANLFFAGIVGLIVCDAGRPWLAPLRDRRLCYLGRISYGIYLYHLIVIVFATEFARQAGLPRGPALDLAMVAATLALAAASWELLERPLLRLKDRFPYTQ
jgi:peptidoglycan/LPS O-acetylase OafA/YrhL